MGDDIKVMVHNKHTTDIIATGGQENDLKLWQLKNMDKPVFTAKNVCFIVLFTVLLLSHIDLHLNHHVIS